MAKKNVATLLVETLAGAAMKSLIWQRRIFSDRDGLRDETSEALIDLQIVYTFECAQLRGLTLFLILTFYLLPHSTFFVCLDSV
jgi:hypothetical protein